MQLRYKRGDTLIEVMFSITVFAIIAVISVGLMNGGIYTAQKTLEVTMARNEIDAQSEALRFIQNSYLAEKNLSSNQEFSGLWRKLTEQIAVRPEEIESEDGREVFDIGNKSSCSEVYEGDNSQVRRFNAFVLNTRLMQPEGTPLTIVGGEVAGNYDDLLDNMVVGAVDEENNTVRLKEAALYPRILYSRLGGGEVSEEALDDSSGGNMLEGMVYRKVAWAEGIWVIAVRGGNGANDAIEEPEFYDFYVRTCWHAIGRNAVSTIGSIVRLYNPEVVD